MPSAREDWLQRLIQQMATLARRLRERLTGASESDAADVEREAGDAIGTLLGSQATLLQALDPASAVPLAGGAERVVAWIALLRVQADARRARGDDAHAARLDIRAAALERAARAHFGEAMPRMESPGAAS